MEKSEDSPNNSRKSSKLNFRNFFLLFFFFFFCFVIYYFQNSNLISSSSQTYISSKPKLNLKEIKELLLSKDKPKRGTHYKAILCTLVRQELDLKEFLIRNFLSGFQHIRLYDNNRLQFRRDWNISPVIEPFVEMGLVSHVSWYQYISEPLDEDINKKTYTKACYDDFKNKTDWFAFYDRYVKNKTLL